MIISTKIRYGLRALIMIAAAPENKGILQKDIAAHENVSNKYLDHIVIALKRANIIKNYTSKKSGYILTRDAKDILLIDIYLAFEPCLCLVDCLKEGGSCPRQNNCLTQPVWRALNKRFYNFMKNVSLQDVIDGKDLDFPA